MMSTANSVWKKLSPGEGGFKRGEFVILGSGSNGYSRLALEAAEDQNETPEERARRMGVPYVKPHPVLPIVNGNPVVAVCGGCGRDVHYMEGYSCPKSECPIQRRVVF
jgi:hypothetical protein